MRMMGVSHVGVELKITHAWKGTMRTHDSCSETICSALNSFVEGVEAIVKQTTGEAIIIILKIGPIRSRSRRDGQENKSESAALKTMKQDVLRF